MQKILIVVFSLTCLCFQCHSGHLPGYAKITVVDGNYHPHPGAIVTIKEPSNNIISSGSSDGNGIYFYEQRSPREEILEVVVESGDDIYHGAGIIQIIPGRTTELTIMLD